MINFAKESAYDRNSDKHKHLLTCFPNVSLGPAREPFHHTDEDSHRQLPLPLEAMKPLPRCGVQRWKLEQKNGAQVAPPDWQLRKQILGFTHSRDAHFHAVRNISPSLAGGIVTRV